MGRKNYYLFGVFYRGKLVAEIGRTWCSAAQAAIIVGIFDLAREAAKEDLLKEGHYFACDFVNRLSERRGK